MNGISEAAESEDTAGRDNARVIYFLYLCGLAAGVTAVVGVVMAYMHRNTSPRWLQSHFRFQIRTFWIGIAFLAGSAALAFNAIGLTLLVGWLIWGVLRITRALSYLDRGQAHPRSLTWAW